MGRKCCVPHCYTGYRKSKERPQKETGSLFKVPEDDYFREEWNKAIAREDRPVTPKDFVCFKHFSDEDFIKRRFVKNAVEEYKLPKLKPDAIPSIFPDLPDHIIKMCKKRRKIEAYVKTEDKTVIPLVQIKEEPCEETEINAGEIEIKTEMEEIEYVEEDSSPSSFKCDKCEYESIYKNNLKTHQTKHEEVCKYTCDHCPQFKTKWLETYKSHMRIKHNVGPQKNYCCNFCPFETKVQVCWRRHMDRHKRNNVEESNGFYNCHLCSYKTKIEACLKKHIEKHNKLDCDMCNFYTDNQESFKAHIESYHNDTSVINRPLFGMFNASQKFEHVIVKEEPLDEYKETLSCKDCNYTTKSEECLLMHQRIKHSKSASKAFKCAECNFVSKTVLCLKLHMKKHN